MSLKTGFFKSLGNSWNFQSKRGFQLSMSVIVTIIMGIVLLGMGILLLNKFIGDAEDIKAQLDTETDNQLSVLLESGQRVALPFNSFTMRRGEQKIVGLGILNIDDNLPQKVFNVEIRASTAFDKQNQLITNFTNMTEWVRYDASALSIKSKENIKMPMLFMVPDDALSGDYVFDVKVVYSISGDPYDIKKLYITVP